MLAQPTPASAWPARAQRLAVYAAQHPVWTIWPGVGAQLWAAAPTLDASGLATATEIAHVAAWTLDGLFGALPADVALWVRYGPPVRGAWRTWQALALQTPATAPTQTLRLTPPAQGALAQLLAWDPVRGTNGPGRPGSVLAQVLGGVSLVAAPTAATPPAGTARYHVLTADDTLPALAARYLHDLTAWPAIAAANQLRPPYISDRLADQYGPPVADWVVGANGTAEGTVLPIAAGATTVALRGVVGAQVPVGSILVAEQWGSAGRQQQAVIVTAWAAGTATVAPAFVAAYGDGARITLNTPPAWRLTHVAQPGQTLAIPGAGIGATRTLPAIQDPYGTDLAVTAAGRLTWTGTGDLAVAEGLANVQASLVRRLETALGTLAMHPASYGSGLPSVLGRPIARNHVVAGYVRAALLQDPRVRDVGPVAVTRQDTTWILTATVVLVTGATLPVGAALAA